MSLYTHIHSHIRVRVRVRVCVCVLKVIQVKMRTQWGNMVGLQTMEVVTPQAENESYQDDKRWVDWGGANKHYLCQFSSTFRPHRNLTLFFFFFFFAAAPVYAFPSTKSLYPWAAVKQGQTP